ncbi:MAG: hypothetical protein ABI586_04280 [Candidatus Nanopelagicales bacterium]
MTRHPIDAVSLVAGLVFAAVAVLYVIAEHSTVDIDARWVLPLALIGLGIGGVVGAVSTATRQRNAASRAVTELDTDEPIPQSE